MKEVKRSNWFSLEGYLAATVWYEDGSRKTVLQHREVMEKDLGRSLLSSEIVHHKDHNKINNLLSNLEVLSNTEHATLHAADRPAEILTLVCVGCNNSFERRANQERHLRKQSKAGPFCSKTCAGKNTGLKTEIPHGTPSAYRYFKCRCVLCKEAHALEARKYRAKKTRSSGGMADAAG